MNAKQHVVEPAEPEAIRFGLRALMGAMTLLAVLLAALTNLGFVGALLAFILAVIFSGVMLARQKNPPGWYVAYDLLWGIVVPVICLTFDPILFHPHVNPEAIDLFGPPVPGSLTIVSAVGYGVLAFQMLVLLVWVIIGRADARIAGFVSGTLTVGFGTALLIGVALVIPSVIGVLFWGIGFLGLTPWATAMVFLRRARQAHSIADRGLAGVWQSCWFVSGAVAALVLPLGAVGVLHLTQMILAGV